MSRRRRGSGGGVVTDDTTMVPPLPLTSSSTSSSCSTSRTTRRVLVPQPLRDNDNSSWRPYSFGRVEESNNDDDDEDPTVDLVRQLGICYWHTTVVQGRHHRCPTTNNDHDDRDLSSLSLSLLLALLDLPSCAKDCHLVLGLNNHHVGSYYWARSAGSGASMEAPGINVLVVNNNNDDDNNNGSGYCCALAWQDTQRGPSACNSNDGKRSEWVNFLRPGDQVQLVPHDASRAIQEWMTTTQSCIINKNKNKIYGVSCFQRPMGSEPVVVCEWELQEIQN